MVSNTTPLTPDTLKTWYERDIARYARWDKHAQIQNYDEERVGKFREDEPPPNIWDAKQELRICLYTETNRYSIRAGVHPDGHNYLGCTASSRKPRAGEDWTRGSDLPDGPLTEETWQKILYSIVSYELVALAKKPDYKSDIPSSGLFTEKSEVTS